MAIDANDFQEQERRREAFGAWLVKAWDYAGDEGHPALATAIAELLTHVDELDYPLWEQAKRIPGLWEKALLEACGAPVPSPRASEWERGINYSPVIKLDPEAWDYLYRQLGWANRDMDMQASVKTFWLWSNQGNVVRFAARQPVRQVEQKEEEE